MSSTEVEGTQYTYWAADDSRIGITTSGAPPADVAMGGKVYYRNRASLSPKNVGARVAAIKVAAEAESELQLRDLKYDLLHDFLIASIEDNWSIADREVVADEVLAATRINIQHAAGA